MAKGLKIYKTSISSGIATLKKYPTLFLPFLYLAIIELSGLVAIYFSPQYPLYTILAKPIRAFYSESALHYPYNLLVLPKIFRIWQIISNIIFGSLLTGITISMYNQQAKNMSVRFGKNFKIAFNRYLPLFAYSCVVFIAVYAFEHYSGSVITNLLIKNKGYFLKMGRLKWGIILAFLNISFSLLIEMMLIYVPVVIIILNKGFFKAAIISIKTSIKYFIATFLIIFIPVLVYLGVVILKLFIPGLMLRYFPEISFLIVLLGIALVFFINVIIAVSSTSLFMMYGEQKVEK